MRVRACVRACVLRRGAASLTRPQALNASGFLAILAVYSGRLRCGYAPMVLFTALGFGGNGAMLLPGLVTSLGNFPEVRGMVTGLLKSVFFLCASLYTELDLAVEQDAPHFLILLALLPAAAALACIPFLKPLGCRRAGSAAAAAQEGLATRRTFFAASALTIGLALYMAITVLLQTEAPSTFLPFVPLAFTLMLLLLALYAALPAVYAALGGRAAAPQDTQALLAGERGGVYGSVPGAEQRATEDAEDEEHYVGDAANITLLQCLGRADYWCIYSMYVINLAVGLTLSNNLEAVATSKGAGLVAGYVAISSVATCLGTLLGAHASEAALDAHIALQRPWCVAPAFGLVALGCVMVAGGGRGLLYAAVFVTMLGYGANLSILPAVLHERYGQRHFGSIWAFSQTAMVLASSLFATALAARIYEAHATLDPATGLQTCVGGGCFRTTFLVLALLAALGGAIGGALATLLTAFYAQLAAARSKAEPGGYFAALTGGKGPRQCDDL